MSKEELCREEGRITAVEVKTDSNSKIIWAIIFCFMANIAIGGTVLYKAGGITKEVSQLVEFNKSISQDVGELKKTSQNIITLNKDVSVLQEKISWIEEQILDKKGF